ncbi:helix-turn-helix domain-containing protein [Halomarina ordinaria]|uniref:Helix-turn-helix domain-containing protein n=1 Tax=Halomarina ordinaria TaxID=3033939 RepID=A0ABD5UBC9_9EURY|nr:winged helix-turn-helix domain-containing protein [Halomarina sp. PSRA2]
MPEIEPREDGSDLDIDTVTNARFREDKHDCVLYALREEGKSSARELGETLGRSENGLHYHLDRLVDAGLVVNRRQSVPGRDGLYSYYELTGLGADLIDAERTAFGAY